jgi:hypothetical protein
VNTSASATIFHAPHSYRSGPTQNAVKRGEGVALEELHESRITARVPDDEVLAVQEALDTPAQEEPISAQVV